MSEYPPSLAAALAVLQTRLPRIAKSETAKVVSQKGSYSYTYAGLADISAQVLPLLGAVGLSFTAKPTFDDNGRYVLACTLRHTSGDTDEGIYLLPTGGTPQSLGSAITYGRRYILCAMTGIAPDEDDDGASAEAAAASQPRTAQRSKPTAAEPGTQPRTTQRARRPAPAEPPLPDEPGYQDGTSRQAPRGATRAGAKPVTRDQLDKLHAQLGDLEITERADKLTTVGLLVKRPLATSNDLTIAEASGVIDQLDKVLAADAPVKALDAVLDQLEQADQAGAS